MLTLFKVLLKKGGTSHKRFTVTFAITGDGKLLKSHLLFSGLKNKPTVNKDVLVEVNKTGMWNDDILLQFVKDAVISRMETSFLREPILLIIDSYGVHIKLAESKNLEKFNIFTVIVPPNLTNILQPLDVAVNRSFQSFYQTCYDKYIGHALEDPALQTRAGNPRVPNYLSVSNWIVEWTKTKTVEQITNDFLICGLLPKRSFDLSLLHPALKAIFEPSFDIDSWNDLYSSYIDTESVLVEETFEPPNWYLPDSENASLYMCVSRKVGGNESSWEDYKTELLHFMRSLPELQDITSESYYDDLEQDNAAEELEIYAVSIKENWNIKVVNAETASSVLYTVPAPVQDVELVQFKRYYGILMISE